MNTITRRTMQLTARIIDTVTAAYIDAVFFTDTGDADQPDSDTPLAASSRDAARIDCWGFLINCDRAGLLDRIASTTMTWDAIGHDFWLTRNHHGAGFWDRGLGDLGKQLTDLAHAAGECNTFEADGELVLDAHWFSPSNCAAANISLPVEG